MSKFKVIYGSRFVFKGMLLRHYRGGLVINLLLHMDTVLSKTISNDQEPTQFNPTSSPKNQKGNN